MLPTTTSAPPAANMVEDLGIYLLVWGVPFLTWAATLWAILFIATFLHEAAHATAAHVVGFKPTNVTVGMPPWILRRRIGCIEWRLGLIPWSGSTHATGMTSKHWWGQLAYAGAGLCSDIVVLIGLWNIWQWSVEDFALFAPVRYAIRYALILEAVSFIHNAFPFSWKSDDEIPNDGRQLWLLLTGKAPRQLREMEESYQREIARYDPDFDMEESWLVHADESLQAIHEDWLSCLDNRQFDRAIPLLETLLGSPLIKGGERARILDQMACLAVIDGHKELSPHALKWAYEARRLAPSSRTVRGTLGSLLIDAGDVRAGMALLEPLVTDANDIGDRAVAACYLAKAWHLLGETEKAFRLLETGRRNKPPPSVYDRIQKEITHPSPMNP